MPWDVEVWEGGKTEPGVLVAGVELVEQQIEPGQPLVEILRRKVHAVVVVPERAQRFIYVTLWGKGWSAEPGKHIRVVLVIEMPYPEKVTGEAVTFRWGVTIVQMGRTEFGNLHKAEELLREGLSIQ